MTGIFYDRYLDEMRGVGDEVADATVRAIFDEHAVAGVDRVVNHLIRNDEVVPDELPTAARDYFESTAVLPEWADPELIRQGEELFIDYGLISSTLLACASLPECYVMKNGIHVLWSTQKLEQHVYRRVLETAQMIMDVMRPGGLAPGGRGIRAAQKVRLLHASIRHLLLTDGPASGEAPPPGLGGVLHSMNWDSERFGHPICQEDMAYTLLTFSFVVARALRSFGGVASEEQVEAYMHCWNVVGHVMGVRPELIPETSEGRYEQGRLLYEMIFARQAGPTDAGQAMEAALLKFLEGLMPKPLHAVPSMLTRHFIGHETSAILGIEEPNFAVRALEKLVIDFLEGLAWIEKKVLSDASGVHKAAEALHLHILEKIGTMPRGWENKLFVLPESLKEDAIL